MKYWLTVLVTLSLLTFVIFPLMTGYRAAPNTVYDFIDANGNPAMVRK